MKKGLAVLALTACSGFAQSSLSAGSFGGTAHFGPPPPFGMRAITGAAYSGEEVSESVQVLADGTRITRTTPAVKVYRDSAGRTRTERPMFMGPARPGQAESPVIIEINDPVARARFILDTQNKVAHRQELPAAPPMPAAAPRKAIMIGGQISMVRESSAPAGPFGVVHAPPPSAAPAVAGDYQRPESKVEKLGTQTIEGVLVEGIRHSNTWPVGSQGNDRPITTVNEVWTSPELKVVILSKTMDPRSGEHTRQVVNLSRSEPDPGLFQPPPGYPVVEEKGDFTIQWSSTQR